MVEREVSRERVVQVFDKLPEVLSVIYLTVAEKLNPKTDQQRQLFLAAGTFFVALVSFLIPLHWILLLLTVAAFGAAAVFGILNKKGSKAADESKPEPVEEVNHDEENEKEAEMLRQQEEERRKEEERLKEE